MSPDSEREMAVAQVVAYRSVSDLEARIDELEARLARIEAAPPVDLGRCAATDGFECRAVGQAVAGYRRENEVLRSNYDHLSSENASLSSQVESMALRIESLAEELAKPEDVRLREVVAALDGHAVIFDGLGSRVEHLLAEMDHWIARASQLRARRKGGSPCATCRATNAKAAK